MSDVLESEIYDKAANIIEERGWCQNAMENFRGNVCMSYAIHLADRSFEVVAGKSFIGKTFRLTERFQRIMMCRSIVDYNDRYCTSKEEAISTLRKLATHCRILETSDAG